MILPEGPSLAGRPVNPGHPASPPAGEIERLPPNIRTVQWLIDGERGPASVALAARAIGLRAKDEPPPDCADEFRRCVLFIRQVPEALGALSALGGDHAGWSVLAGKWAPLVESLIRELGPALTGDHAPKTTAALRKLLRLPEANTPPAIGQPKPFANPLPNWGGKPL